MRRILAVLMTMALVQPLIKAQGFDPTVEVSRNFEGRVGDIQKPALPVSASDSTLKFEHSTNYSIFEKPYGNLYEFTPYDALRIKPMDPVRLPLLYARFGLQLPLTPLAEVHLQKVTKGGVYLNMALHHDSFIGSIPAASGDWSISHRNTNNDASANLKYAWTTGEAFAGVRYDYNTRFQAAPASKTASDNYGGLNIAAGLRSTKANENNLYYDFRLNYRNSKTSRLTDAMTDRSRVAENFFDLSGWVGTTFDIHRVYIDMSIKFANYDGLKDYTVSVVEFSPIYEYKSRRFNGRFGVKFGNRFGLQDLDASRSPDGNNLNALSSVYPDIDARVEIIKRKLWAHAVFGGGYDLNSFSSFSEKCPLLTPETPMMMGSRPLDMNISLEGVGFGRFAAILTGGFVMNRAKAIFAPVVTTARIPTEIRLAFVDANVLSGCLEAFWKSESVTVGGEIRLNRNFSLTSTPVTELPAATGRLYCRYNWQERIITSLDYDFRSSVSGSTYGDYTIPGIHNIEFTADYVLNRHITIYGKLGNILGRANQYIPLYPEPGFNFGGGVAIVF